MSFLWKKEVLATVIQVVNTHTEIELLKNRVIYYSQADNGRHDHNLRSLHEVLAWIILFEVQVAKEWSKFIPGVKELSLVVNQSNSQGVKSKEIRNKSHML